jgi:hypothetical protein
MCNQKVVCSLPLLLLLVPQVVGNQENDHSLRNLILLQLKKVRVAQGH